MSESTLPEKGGLSRRSMVRGAAWTAPAVLVVATAPGAAASPGPEKPVTVVQSATACKHPGNANFKTYHFTFTFSTSAALVGNAIHLVSMTVNGVTRPVSPVLVLVTPGQPSVEYVDAAGFGDSANGIATLNFTYTVQNPFKVVTDSVVAGDVSGLNPCGTGGDPNPKNFPHLNSHP